MFKIEDESHAEPQVGEYSTFNLAMMELRRRATLPWDEAPNRCPCTSWKTCGRRYEIIEYDVSQRPWGVIDRTEVLEVSAKGARWLIESKADQPEMPQMDVKHVEALYVSLPNISLERR